MDDWMVLALSNDIIDVWSRNASGTLKMRITLSNALLPQFSRQIEIKKSKRSLRNPIPRNFDMCSDFSDFDIPGLVTTRDIKAAGLEQP
jgi:hypothetical protein